MTSRVRAFTIIELIIVILIVVILVSIAKPPVHQVTPRSLVSRVRADSRSYGAALDAYQTDHGVFPSMVRYSQLSLDRNWLRKIGGEGLSTLHPGNRLLAGITTPVAYTNALYPDPFLREEKLPIAYYTDGKGWLLFSPGPDQVFDITDPSLFYTGSDQEPSKKLLLNAYDPTNGLISGGDIWRMREIESDRK